MILPMKSPPHPGLLVKHDCIEALGLNVTAAHAEGWLRMQLAYELNEVRKSAAKFKVKRVAA